MAKKYQKKSATKKKRTKSRAGGSKGEEPLHAEGLMSGMVGGFRRVLGAEKKKGTQASAWTYFWTALIVIAAVVVIAYNLSK